MALKRTVEDNFGYVRVRGELGRVSRPASGHLYLDLKDDKAVMNGVVWKGVANRLKIKPEQGLEVICTGKLTTFPGQSRYQIVIDNMEPAGVGALMALLEERKKKLAAEGLFAPENKQDIPYLPRTIGVVTSPSGAVIRDILHRLADRFPRHVLVWPVRVQGETSAAEVAAGINGFNAMTPEGPIPRPDLIIVARGGGSVEDLWSFNEEVVVRAAAASKIPLISAVGHETDTTLIDYASDRRAPTPTAAAEMAVPVRSELHANMLDLERRLYGAQIRLLENTTNRLQALARALPSREDLFALPAQRLDHIGLRLAQSLRSTIEAKTTRFARLEGRMSPQPLRHNLERQRERVSYAGTRLAQGLSASTRAKQEQLSRLESKLSARPINMQIGQALTRLGDLQNRMAGGQKHHLEAQAARLAQASRLLDSYSYQSVLQRGFALVRDEQGDPIRASQGLLKGQMLHLEFAKEDRINVRVEEAGAAKPQPKAKSASPSQKAGSKTSPNQGTLL
ncbi:MAG: exodeoxyribonuclease VII large subunit [Parvibaculaceae bacterium]|jgi:exodeoxyribonuclease VII large subunit